MRNIILTTICCLSVLLNGVICFKSSDKIKQLEETTKYLEVAVESIAAIQASPINKPKTIVLGAPSSSSDLERRIQSLEYDTQRQKSKLKDIELENDYAQYKAYTNSIEQEKLIEQQNKTNKELKDKIRDLERYELNPFP